MTDLLTVSCPVAAPQVTVLLLSSHGTARSGVEERYDFARTARSASSLLSRSSDLGLHVEGRTPA